MFLSAHELQPAFGVGQGFFDTIRGAAEVLGLEQITRPDFGVPGMWLQAEHVQVHLIEVDDHVAPDGQHFALAVDDLDGAVAELTAAGVTVSEPIEIPGAGRQAFLHDPSGNMIELNQPA